MTEVYLSVYWNSCNIWGGTYFNICGNYYYPKDVLSKEITSRILVPFAGKSVTMQDPRLDGELL